MNIPKLSREQFAQLCKNLNVPSQINEDDIFECYDLAFDNATNLLESNVFGKSQPLNNIVLILYLINEYSFYTSIVKEIKDKDEALSKITSVALDKYFTNEMLDFRNKQYTSKFSPTISTIQLYLNFILGILNKYPKKNPQETLLVDMASKAFNISKAIIELIITGFETEAFSTWRTLHETECILTLINKHGDKVTQAYLKHMRYALAYRGAIPSKEETDGLSGKTPPLLGRLQQAQIVHERDMRGDSLQLMLGLCKLALHSSCCLDIIGGAIDREDVNIQSIYTGHILLFLQRGASIA